MIARLFFLAMACVLLLTSANSQDTKSLIKQADAAYLQKNYEESANLYAQARRLGATGSIIPFNAARSFARAGFADSAFSYIKKSLDNGWASPDNLEREQAFNSLHEDPEWEKCIEQAKSNKTKKELIDKMTTDLKACAAFALQYRNKPKNMNGGGNSFYGFALSPQYSTSDNGRYTAIVMSSDMIEITGHTLDGKGVVTARIDRFGKLSNFINTGIFK